VTVFQNYPFRARTLYATAAELTAANPVLLEGEWGTEKVTGKRKIGPGAWNDLPYWDAGGSGGGGPELSDSEPQPLGIAAAGTAEDASRSDHVHAMPTAFGQNLTSTELFTTTFGFGITNNLPGVAMLGSEGGEAGDGLGGAVVLQGVAEYTESRVAEPIDQGRALYFESETDVEYTINLGDWQRGANIWVVQIDVGKVTIINGTGEIFVTGPTLSTTNPGDQLHLRFDGNRWRVFASGGSFSGDYGDLDNLPTLGDAAGLDVGTTAGTVAAGDDARFVTVPPSAQLLLHTIMR
jgi:hypothetical protein